MCGKFTAKASWTEIVDLVWSTPSGDAANDDRSLTYRVMSNLPVIVWDGQRRRVVPIRWGFPDPSDWRRPRPIHARAETVDTVPAFAPAFQDGQRGIVLVDSFNEAPDSGEQHTITPAGPIGIAIVWRRFELASLPMPLLACVMVTVPASELIAGLPADRMPAVLAPADWAQWLGQEHVTAVAAKACLKTMDDVRWTVRREERARTAKRAKPVVSDPTDLF
ncbi:MAG TPA: SOS response-associated peptidase family protein [Rhizomicrobium sp.]|jgi:putative SOS response-associated peptidase YedK